ncbi:MAG: hypothetical protein KF819_05395 [Labilithrix sp.]|nr:hypothetical protein [Labilithrix sp.]
MTASLGTFSAALAACAFVVLAPDRDAAAQQVRDAAPAADAASPISRIPPDPPPMSERVQWVFDLKWDRGDVYLLEVHKVDMGRPHPTPRAMGRFALELYEGPTLIERVRFDFPMLGVPEPPDAGLKTPPRFEPKLTTRIGVLFPTTKRGTKLELWDRARDIRWQLPWPPTEGPVAPGDAPRDAGAR